LGGCEKRAELFTSGNFATLYLSPKDYHRVHMPITGKLKESIFIPGKLFSVSQETAENIPNLFARNERLVCIFDTEIGPMAVILVGAMIVGRINTVWHADTTKKKMTVESYGGSIQLERGAEIGSFELGSTVILLFAKNKMEWDELLKEGSPIKMGQAIGVTTTSN
jgi:phosphatidylserine decarboxylase